MAACLADRDEDKTVERGDEKRERHLALDVHEDLPVHLPAHHVVLLGVAGCAGAARASRWLLRLGARRSWLAWGGRLADEHEHEEEKDVQAVLGDRCGGAERTRDDAALANGEKCVRWACGYAMPRCRPYLAEMRTRLMFEMYDLSSLTMLWSESASSACVEFIMPRSTRSSIISLYLGMAHQPHC